MVELGDVHGGNAVHRSRLLAVDGPQDHLGVEVLDTDDGAAVRENGHDAEHATEAVEVRYGQTHAVIGRELHALADEEAIVEDVAMREHDALGKARRSARVLHHAAVVVVKGASDLVELLGIDVFAEQEQLGHAVETTVLLGPHVDEVLEEGILLGVEVATLLRERFRYQVADDSFVIDVAILVDDAQRLHVALLEHIVELVGLEDRVHRDHDDADLGARVHEGDPIWDVACPYAQMVARTHADVEHAAREQVATLVELGVRPTQVAVRIDHELVIGIDLGLEAQVIAERHLGKQWIVLVAENRDTTVLASRRLHDLCRSLEAKVNLLLRPSVFGDEVVGGHVGR